MGTSARSEGQRVGRKLKAMKSRVTNSAGLILVTCAILLLVIAHRLDLLLIVAPVAALFSFWSARSATRGNTVQRRM
jgi:hypothetical protein